MEQKFITDNQGNKILPITHVNAVRDDNGNTIGSLMGAFEDEVRGLVDTPHENYVTVAAISQTTAAEDVLPDSGQSADTIYRVSNWDGSANSGAGAFDVTAYSEYAWDDVSSPNKFIFLCKKTQIGEVFDITVHNNNTKYDDLASALGTNGANVPVDIRRGGMSVKFVCSSDNKYVQFRYMGTSTANADFTNVANWQVDVTKITLSEDFLGLLSEIKDFTIKNYSILANGKFGTSTTYDHAVIPVSEGEIYYLIGELSSCRYAFATSDSSSSGVDIPLVSGTSVIVMPAVGQYYKLVIPEGCTYLLFNASGSYGTRCFKHYDSIEETGDYEYNKSSIKEIVDDLTLKDYNYIVPSDINQNHRIDTDSTIEESSKTDIYKYTEVVAGNTYAFSNRQGLNYNAYMCFWVDSNDNIIAREPYKGTADQIDIWTNVKITAPENATQMWMNVNHNSVSYANFSSVSEEMVSVQQLVDKDDELEHIKAKKKKIRLLSIGNSYSQDALSYVPFILQNMGIDVDIQIGIAMMSSSTLANHVNNFENEAAAYTYYLYSGGDSWENIGSKSIQYILDDKIWDIVSLQQSSGDVYQWSTYQPYLNKLINYIKGYVENPIKFCWYAVQARPASSNSGANWSDEVITQHFEAICDNAEKVMNETVCEFLIPVNTAIQNARSIATLKAMGAYANNANNTSGLGYLTPNDGVHLQEGLPCQIAAYTFVLKLLDVYGFDEYSINAETTRVTAAWATGKNIPGPHGDYIGSTNENCMIAQASAIMAVKNPYEVTDMNYIINPT